MKKLILSTFVVALGVAASYTHAAREQIIVVGSSTVFPFSKVVAERFGRSTSFNTPTVESVGTGGGLDAFCKGVGVGHPDITNASRRIKASEVEKCENNGVSEIVEVLIGYDGIVLANSVAAKPFKASRKELFLALAKQVPNPNGKEELIDNPYKTWNEINAALPANKIHVYGPPPSSGTRDAFVELAMEAGCKKFDWIKAIKKQDKTRYKAICHAIREDGSYTDTGEQDNVIVQKLDKSPKSVGIFGFSYLDQNIDKVQPALIDGVEPEFESIVDGSYPISRPLYFYVKKAHVSVIPGIVEYLSEFTSEKAWGDEGYLVDKGMIPLSSEKRKEIKSQVTNLTPLKL